MDTINISSTKMIHYPEFCPVCGKTDRLKRFPLGEKDTGEIYIPIHRKCWHIVTNKSMKFALICIITSVSIFIVMESYGIDIRRRLFILLLIPVFMLIDKIYPIPVEVKREKETIEFKFRNEYYAEEFMRLNGKIIKSHN